MSNNTTPTLAIGLGAVAIVLGIGAYIVTSFASLTALIPALFGVLFVALGVVGRNPARSGRVTYGIAGLALLSVLGSARGVPDILAVVTGESVDSLVAVLTQGGLIAIGLILLGAAVADQLQN